MNKQIFPVFVGAMASLILMGAGCASSVFNTAGEALVTQNPAPASTEKKIYWCDFEEDSKTGLWISSNYYSGMNHAPTDRHICRGKKELFYLIMDWDDTTNDHIGSLFAVNSSSTFPISSVNKDPELKLLDTQNVNYSNQIRFSIDGKVIIFDESKNNFSN